MGTTQSDAAGWAGWAISSFTNKIATASGDIQPKVAKAQPPNNDRSSSVPPGADSSRGSASIPTIHRQAVTGASTPLVVPTPPPEKYFSSSLGDEQEIDDAWGEMAEDDFFDAPSESQPAPAPPVSFDDGGEPDFEGWLNAQAQAKSKTPLPKSLAKPSAPARTTTTGSVGSGAGSKKLASTTAKPKPAPAKTISTKPKDTAADDDWGDAWD